MTVEYGTLLKPDPEPCICGCGVVAQLRSKTWGGETGPHVKRCTCRKCKGGRQRGTARKREQRIAKRLGGYAEPDSGQKSGVDIRIDDVVWIEETSNVSLLAGLKRWWLSKGTETKLQRIRRRAKIMGVPVAFVGSWEGKPQVVVMSFDDFENLVRRTK